MAKLLIPGGSLILSFIKYNKGQAPDKNLRLHLFFCNNLFPDAKLTGIEITIFGYFNMASMVLLVFLKEIVVPRN